ncbi:med21 domain-containing protein [Geobacillus thermodenitrificans]|uniref:med21 domain-containing protein n=1 Tax=Geobacillus thermodenitrificans TaxID=33940 RepID=UPI0002F07CAA|nr:med21 domain-containing protein [Geobacillus thermodenitrificans]
MKQDYQQMKELLMENSFLRGELLKAIEEKEKLVSICEELLKEKKYIEERYRNLRQSKLGRITVWIWERRRKKKHVKKK